MVAEKSVTKNIGYGRTEERTDGRTELKQYTLSSSKRGINGSCAIKVVTALGQDTSKLNVICRRDMTGVKLRDVKQQSFN